MNSVITTKSEFFLEIDNEDRIKICLWCFKIHIDDLRKEECKR